MAPPLLLLTQADVHMNKLSTHKTLANPVAIEGVGLHSGIYTRLELHPATAGTGIIFVRTDLRNLRIPALQSSTTSLDHATTVGKDDVSVGTVEHLLAALAACGITDVELLIDGPEIPIIDGSALPFMNLIDAAGIRELDEKIAPIRISRAIEIREGDKMIRIEPSDRLTIRYRIDFDHPLIGKESFHFDLDRETFRRKVAPARTFGFMRDVERLRAAGLARGGSVDNCIVLNDHGLESGTLRFRDEFVRHKILDLVGDLALLGRPLLGEITAYRAGHAMHARLVAEIAKQSEAWTSAEIETVERSHAAAY